MNKDINTDKCCLNDNGTCKASSVCKDFNVKCSDNRYCCYRRKKYWKNKYLNEVKQNVE